MVSEIQIRLLIDSGTTVSANEHIELIRSVGVDNIYNYDGPVDISFIGKKSLIAVLIGFVLGSHLLVLFIY